MQVQSFVNALNSKFYTGVPDSLLKPFCDYLALNMDKNSHITAANEGNAVGLAAGYYLSTKNIPVVYMQNSGIGNIVNPVCSLLHRDVYGIPSIFVVGWRGEPGVHDEPQHVFQGKVTVKLLEDMEIKTFVISKDTSVKEVGDFIHSSKELFENGKSIAFVVKKGALSYDKNADWENGFSLNREEAINLISKIADNDIVISTTGKISRELFEVRQKNNHTHSTDFLNVGSMGHCSSIALAVSLNKPNSKVWCIDGDGSAIMHMGAFATIGNYSPNNLIHIVINNCAHDTVGGMPTVANKIDLQEIAKGSGYKKSYCVKSIDELETVLNEVKVGHELSLVEIKVKLGSRSDLGRPTTTAKENKENFMNFLKDKQ